MISVSCPSLSFLFASCAFGVDSVPCLAMRGAGRHCETHFLQFHTDYFKRHSGGEGTMLSACRSALKKILSTSKNRFCNISCSVNVLVLAMMSYSDSGFVAPLVLQLRHCIEASGKLEATAALSQGGGT